MELLEVAKLFRDYVDAIPKDTALPAMPGFDRDWADLVIEKAERAHERKRRAALKEAKDV